MGVLDMKNVIRKSIEWKDEKPHKQTNAETGRMYYTCGGPISWL